MTRPKLWKATDLKPGRPTRFVPSPYGPHEYKLALTIHCPSCPAKPHHPCTGLVMGVLTPGYHETRVNKARRKAENCRRTTT